MLPCLLERSLCLPSPLLLCGCLAFPLPQPPLPFPLADPPTGDCDRGRECPPFWEEELPCPRPFPFISKRTWSTSVSISSDVTAFTRFLLSIKCEISFC